MHASLLESLRPVQHQYCLHPPSAACTWHASSAPNMHKLSLESIRLLQHHTCIARPPRCKVMYRASAHLAHHLKPAAQMMRHVSMAARSHVSSLPCIAGLHCIASSGCLDLQRWQSRPAFKRQRVQVLAVSLAAVQGWTEGVHTWMGLVPAATIFMPSAIIAALRMVAVVVPSPAVSLVFEAACKQSTPLYHSPCSKRHPWICVTHNCRPLSCACPVALPENGGRYAKRAAVAAAYTVS